MNKAYAASGLKGVPRRDLPQPSCLSAPTDAAGHSTCSIVLVTVPPCLDIPCYCLLYTISTQDAFTSKNGTQPTGLLKQPTAHLVMLATSWK